MRICVLLFLCFCCLELSAQDKEWKLVWEEDFNGTELDESVWNYELGDGCPGLCGWGNNESQIYTKKNHRLHQGKLIITGRKEGSIYTSTRITTKAKKEFKYGKIEVRAQLPVGKGLWPAFWMLGSNIDEVKWPNCGEIDILEYVGKEPGMIFTSLHTKASHGNTLNTRKMRIKGIEEGFHTYTAQWTKDSISFYIDNELVYTFRPEQKTKETWPFDQPFYLIVNMAIGGNFGGPEIDDSALPQNFIIDYIKVYQ
ncbi:family 16 glycosylhydrolase [Leptobacterium flavescens]|uniref:Family 16 glycosylhydrolase n=2 Tax=Leptobacterium flavescens TaxID=472055 RepID=A0A6P0UQE6_9FLAO|nr:family 16 glycosylhydrolase [Leptobacterium flavescens]